ncbi:MAG: transporter substrate-binding domain-containing protein [Spirochaetaceae bacterium]|nr:transporter substrate-binding domain-containing protein [Spirochaetaceae bacterium]
MKVKRIGIAALALLAALACVGCSKNQAGGGGALDAIRKNGVLKVGVKSDVPKFGLLNTSTNQYEGMEIELAELIAKDILGEGGKVEFTAVTAKTRGPLIDNGELDLIVATYTITEERKLSYNFSTPYYTDAVGMLVKRASGIASVADLNNKTIGVAQSATSRDAISAAASAAGAQVSFLEFATYPEIKAALDSGRVDVFSVDGSILAGYLDATTTILPDRFSPQEYGAASKLSNKDLADHVDGLIQKWLSDGTIDNLIKKYAL